MWVQVCAFFVRYKTRGALSQVCQLNSELDRSKSYNYNDEENKKKV